MTYFPQSHKSIYGDRVPQNNDHTNLRYFLRSLYISLSRSLSISPLLLLANEYRSANSFITQKPRLTTNKRFFWLTALILSENDMSFLPKEANRRHGSFIHSLGANRQRITQKGSGWPKRLKTKIYLFLNSALCHVNASLVRLDRLDNPDIKIQNIPDLLNHLIKSLALFYPSGYSSVLTASSTNTINASYAVWLKSVIWWFFDNKDMHMWQLPQSPAGNPRILGLIAMTAERRERERKREQFCLADILLGSSWIIEIGKRRVQQYLTMSRGGCAVWHVKYLRFQIAGYPAIYLVGRRGERIWVCHERAWHQKGWEREGKQNEPRVNLQARVSDANLYYDVRLVSSLSWLNC
jgi:hypothetical protein